MFFVTTYTYQESCQLGIQCGEVDGGTFEFEDTKRIKDFLGQSIVTALARIV